MIISTVRLTDEMHAYLSAWSEREHRSLHNLIVWILTQAIDRDEKLAQMKRRLT
jgi:hypothetical protein